MRKRDCSQFCLNDGLITTVAADSEYREREIWGWRGREKGTPKHSYVHIQDLNGIKPSIVKISTEARHTILSISLSFSLPPSPRGHVNVTSLLVAIRKKIIDKYKFFQVRVLIGGRRERDSFRTDNEINMKFKCICII